MLNHPDTQALFREGRDYIMANWSTPVRLLYSQITQDCPNCIEIGPWGSTNQYRPGGPIEFTTGRCPYCGGSGKIESSEHKDTVARIRRVKKEEFGEINPIEYPNGVISVLARMEDLEDFRRCEYMIVNPDFEPEQKYKRLNEPFDRTTIVRGEYVNMIWQRV